MGAIGYCPVQNLQYSVTLGNTWIKNRLGIAVESDANYKPVTITIELDADLNKLLSQAAKRSRRSKKDEALIRLVDHLQLVQSVGAEGNRFLYTKKGGN